MLSELESGYNDTELTINIGIAKDDNPVDYNTINRCSKKYLLGCNNVDEKIR